MREFDHPEISVQATQGSVVPNVLVRLGVFGDADGVSAFREAVHVRRNCGKDMLRFIVKNQLSVNMFYRLYMVQLHLYMLLQQLKLCSALELIQIQFTNQFQDVQELLNSSSPYSNHKAF